MTKRTILACFLVLAPGVALAQSEIELKVDRLITFGGDAPVARLTDVRAQLVVESQGRMTRCYKQYRRNWPHGPQITPYMITQNLKPSIDDGRLGLDGLLAAVAQNESALRSAILTRCTVASSVILLIEGRLAGGASFRSNATIRFAKQLPVSIQVGSARYSLEPWKTSVVDLIPTALFGANWSSVWEPMNPADGMPRRNY